MMVSCGRILPATTAHGASAWQAMAELVTVRLAELVSARLSDGCRVPLQSADEVHDRNWGREEGKA
jgi:hypothetical protein